MRLSASSETGSPPRGKFLNQVGKYGTYLPSRVADPVGSVSGKFPPDPDPIGTVPTLATGM